MDLLANYWMALGPAKLPGFYDLLRRATPGPRLDVFGRRRIAGFDSWGNEATDLHNVARPLSAGAVGGL